MQAQDIFNVLDNKEKLKSSINFDEIITLTDNAFGNDLQAELTFSKQPLGLGVTKLVDEINLFKKNHFSKFPIKKFEITVHDGKVYPTKNFFMATEHAFFNVHFGVGKSRKIKDRPGDLLIIPFSLLHNNANCVHNGIMLITHSDERFSNALLQISSETCAYMKFDYVSVFAITANTKNTTTSVKKHTPYKDIYPIKNLYEEHGFDYKVFADSAAFKQENVTIFGLIDGEEHYIGGCLTRNGTYPICEQLLLPSYSLAKSLAGTVGMSLLENKYGNISDLIVADLLQECDLRQWRDVTLENLSDMATGNFLKLGHDLDESGFKQTKFIFNASTHAEKLKQACTAYPRKSRPGKKFVYHTSDTYILGASFNAFLKKSSNLDDYYSEILAPFYQSMGMSYALSETLRTTGETSQAFTGWGMYLLRDDIEIISNFIHNQTQSDSSQYAFLKKALDEGEEKIEAIPGANISYNNGFWQRKYDAGTFGCEADTWIPFMSGFGGVTVAFLPNRMTYYYFSDGYTYSWDSAVFAANKIRPFCN